MSPKDDLRDLLTTFTRTLDEANEELLAEVRGEVAALRRELLELRAELGIARAEAALALRQSSGAKVAEEAAPEGAQPAPGILSQELQEELRQRHEEVWRLCQAGEGPQEVARRTNRPIGEVELIMRLIGPRSASSARQRR